MDDVSRPQKIDYPPDCYRVKDSKLSMVTSIVSKEALLEDYKVMQRIRQFEVRAKASYLEGKIGGFFHSYAGEEASCVSVIRAFGRERPYTATYRCHGLALALGADTKACMAELFGKKTGIVGGRGGSMHFHFKNGKSILTGGFGIVGGHLPLAAGTSFALKYLGEKNPLALCFLGDGAAAQGVFHETLNLAALWKLPTLYVIENNTYSMGTHVERGIAFRPLAKIAEPYGLKWCCVDGRSYSDMILTLESIRKEMEESQKPFVLEVLVDRYEGHSMSDSMPYRTREDIDKLRSYDPIALFGGQLIEAGIATEGGLLAISEEIKNEVLEAIKAAEDAPYPDLGSLGEGVYG